MAAQHREIERLVESRQRLQTLKDQIASLHQSVATSPTPSKRGSGKERERETGKMSFFLFIYIL